MALTQQQLIDLSAEYQRYLSANGITVTGALKADILAMFTSIDAWVESNQASFNSALPLVARNNLSPQEKANVLYLDLKKRFGG